MYSLCIAIKEVEKARMVKNGKARNGSRKGQCEGSTAMVDENHLDMANEIPTDCLSICGGRRQGSGDR